MSKNSPPIDYSESQSYGDLFDRWDDPHEMNYLWYSNPDLRRELVEAFIV